MIRIKDAGGHTSHYSTSLLALDALLHAPTSGHQRAFHTRKQLAYCQADRPEVGPTDVFEVPVTVTVKRQRRIDPMLKLQAELGFH